MKRTTENAEIVPTVYVVDDDISVRESLDTLIRMGGWRPKCFTSAEEFLVWPRTPIPSCLIVDYSLPHLDGLELQRLIADRAEMPVIFVTGQPSIAMTVRAMKSGAVEFLTKPFRNEAILSAIGEALSRSHRALAREAETRVLRNRFRLLSPREQQVLGLVVAGRLNKQIADTLRISEITVKAHRGKVMRKMAARTLAELVKLAGKLQRSQVSTGSHIQWPEWSDSQELGGLSKIDIEDANVSEGFHSDRGQQLQRLHVTDPQGRLVGILSMCDSRSMAPAITN